MVPETGGLPVYHIDDLPDGDLGECLVAADNDHRLTAPALLLVRSEARQARTVCFVLPGGLEGSASIPPASVRPSLRHPFGQEPTDTVIGPLGAGPVTYLPSPRGLRVLAYTREGAGQ
jgi:hypothetical protein